MCVCGWVGVGGVQCRYDYMLQQLGTFMYTFMYVQHHSVMQSFHTIPN